uniref:Glycine receptor subunit alphaZ1-like n=1 Tax=Petromyzon marinus TaxID=7757 RepID=A0AAJ7UJ50_PETMA|nr:glycine receptor subunit alphaZ1-like [Petromyzon marinus]
MTMSTPTGDPVVVNISIYLKSFSDIQESTMDYRVTLTLWQRWNDDRLRYSSRDFNATDLDESNAAFMWKPDLYFGNEESATVHTVTTPNSMLRIHDNGDVLYSMRSHTATHSHSYTHSYTLTPSPRPTACCGYTTTGTSSTP